jgi:hypothetical protein
MGALCEADHKKTAPLLSASPPHGTLIVRLVGCQLQVQQNEC